MKKCGARRVREDDRLPAQRPDLGPADVENVAAAGDLHKGEVVPGCGQPVPEPRPVEEQGDAVLRADLMQRPQLGGGVEGPVLGRVGEVDHPGRDHVGAAFVGVKPRKVPADLRGGELALLLREREHLVAAGLDRPGFMAVDMAGDGGQHPFVPGEQRVDDDGVGLGAAHEEMHRRARAAAGRADLFPRRLAPGVGPVAGRLLQICLQKLGKQRRVRALQVIALKMQHKNPSFRSYSSIIPHPKRIGNQKRKILIFSRKFRIFCKYFVNNLS